MQDYDPPRHYYRAAGAYYASQLQRIAAVVAAVGSTTDLEPMERSAVCKEALVRIAFLANSVPGAADLRPAGVPE